MKLTRNFNINDYELFRFFSYTTVIPHNEKTLELDYLDEKLHPNLCQKFDEVYRELVKAAVAASGKSDMYFNDNKTVFQLKHKRSGEFLFIGRYDLSRAIGESCIQYFGTIYDFRTKKQSEYLSDVMCEGFYLWKKFDI